MTDPVTNEEAVEADGASTQADAPAEPPLEDDGSTSDTAEDGTAAATEADSGDPSQEGDDGEGNSELAGLQDEYDGLNDRHLRLVAEFNNFRRRTEQERLGAWARAQADVIAKFLDVLDDLNRVADLDLSNATVEAIIEGVDLVEKKFIRVLEDSGVEVIDPAAEAFDPERMEAVMRVPADSDDQDDVVAQVFQKGYSLKGILVRPARVSVYKSG